MPGLTARTLSSCVTALTSVYKLAGPFPVPAPGLFAVALCGVGEFGFEFSFTPLVIIDCCISNLLPIFIATHSSTFAIEFPFPANITTTAFHLSLPFSTLSLPYGLPPSHTPILLKSTNPSSPCPRPTPKPPNSSPTPRPRTPAIDRVRSPGGAGAASNNRNSHRRRPRRNRSNLCRPWRRRVKRPNPKLHPGPCSRLSTLGRTRPRWTGP